MKVYVVVSHADGEDYDGSDIYVEGVYDTLEKTQVKMNEVFDSNFAPSEEDSADVDKDDTSCSVINFDADYNACVWIKEKEVE